MKKNIRRIIFCASLLFCGWTATSAPLPLYTFESKAEIPLKAEGKARLDNKFVWQGNSSLRWDWKKGDRLYFPMPEDAPIKFRTKFHPTFSMYMGMSAPVQDSLQVVFTSGGFPVKKFAISLDFKGWQTAWVSYMRDMKNFEKGSGTIDSFYIEAPTNTSKGTLYLDQLFPVSYIDPRYAAADARAPYLNPEVTTSANRHWQALYHYSQLAPFADANRSGVTEEERQAVDTLSRRLEYFYVPGVIASPQKKYDEVAARYTDSKMAGVPVVSKAWMDVLSYSYSDKNKKAPLKCFMLEAYTKDMLTLAQVARADSVAATLAEALFIKMYRHLHQTNWAWGNCPGTVHHLGYEARSYYQSLFLMRDALQKAGLLAQGQQDIWWFTGAGRMYDTSDPAGINVDILNTTVAGILGSILMEEDQTERIFLLRDFCDWLSREMKIAPGLTSPFKVDGSFFHHMNNYTLYGRDGFKGICPVVYIISQTPFALGNQAHELLRLGMLRMREYCSDKQIPVSMSGRHPTGKGFLIEDSYYYMAKAGRPMTSEDVDAEMAGVFLRLADAKKFKEQITELTAAGFKPEMSPKGNLAMNYASIGSQRRAHWLFVVKGFSKYLWGAEIYAANNHYGRYISYGHYQIMSSDPNKSFTGFSHDGWDWNKFPGTTAIELPFDKLIAGAMQVDENSGVEELLLGGDAFSGACSFAGNGMFAIKLYEHPKYYGSHRANKSYFMFGDLAVMLGSDIYNDVKDYPTITTLFQQPVEKGRYDALDWDGKKIDSLGFYSNTNLKASSFVRDMYANLWYVPAAEDISVSLMQQDSRDQGNDAPTKGEFAAAWIGHGHAPQGKKYEYAVLIQPSAEREAAVSAALKSKKIYSVEKQDSVAHVLHYLPEDVWAYAVFSPEKFIAGANLLRVDTPVMVMLSHKGTKMQLSITDPDLRLYEGIDKDQYGSDGKRREVSAYSRPWRANQSREKVCEFEIAGSWKLTQGQEVYRAQVSSVGGNTLVRIPLQHALTRELTFEAL